MQKKIFLDANVIIALFKGNNNVAKKAYEIINDAEIQIVCSDALWLELMPKAIYNKNIEEKEFYQTIFDQSEYITWDTEVLENSKTIAQTYGIAALDAIHIATALSVNVEKFYTAEKNTKPMFRVSEINVVSLLNS